MYIESMGYNHPHDHTFVIDRPKGCGNWLFLLIKTPAVVRTEGTEYITTAKNSYILYRPNTPQNYGANHGEYIDDWIHFVATEQDVLLFETLKIPINEVMELGNVTDITKLIRNITYEFYTAKLHKAEITELYMNLLFYKISEAMNTNINADINSSSPYLDRFMSLRNDIYNSPQNNWNIDQMSSALSMSRSSFQHSYKKIFGVGVINDVINSRLIRVKHYLSTSDMTLSEIAPLCGYKNELYLMRQFKEKSGITPSEYRRSL